MNGRKRSRRSATIALPLSGAHCERRRLSCIEPHVARSLEATAPSTVNDDDVAHQGVTMIGTT